MHDARAKSDYPRTYLRYYIEADSIQAKEGWVQTRVEKKARHEREMF